MVNWVIPYADPLLEWRTHTAVWGLIKKSMNWMTSMRIPQLSEKTPWYLAGGLVMFSNFFSYWMSGFGIYLNLIFFKSESNVLFAVKIVRRALMSRCDWPCSCASIWQSCQMACRKLSVTRRPLCVNPALIRESPKIHVLKLSPHGYVLNGGTFWEVIKSLRTVPSWMD